MERLTRGADGKFRVEAGVQDQEEGYRNTEWAWWVAAGFRKEAWSVMYDVNAGL